MWKFGIGLVGMASGGLLGGAGAIAQTLPPCQPPNPNEFLVMVLDPTPNNQQRLRQALPRNTVTTVCDYLGTPVTRIGGFIRSETANAWAQYFTEIGNFQTFVARPAAVVPPPTSPVRPSPQPAPTPTLTAAQPLGSGYAVLVPDANRAETAATIQRVSGNPVGLVSYEQRSYLLAGYTADAAVAANLLKTLSDRGLSVMIVDGRRAVLLSPAVPLQ